MSVRPRYRLIYENLAVVDVLSLRGQTLKFENKCIRPACILIYAADPQDSVDLEKRVKEARLCSHNPMVEGGYTPEEVILRTRQIIAGTLFDKHR